MARTLEEQEERAADPARKWNGYGYVPDVDGSDEAEFDPPEVVRMKLQGTG